MSESSRNRTVSISSGRSSRGRGQQMQDFTMSSSAILRFFEPTAATASMFLYAQGSSIVCCHHDSLTIERRFSRHSDEVQLLAVDNQSELGAGRLVVSYDAGQTAIVWDLATGDEVARFASYEHLTTASWMRNGNVAFGNTQGNIILFEPTTSEHISARTIDQIAVTALAPAADCRTFAIGYQNGSLLIATLQPRFTILHNLSTSRGPSPIVCLNWHASSSRQKSDMLAVQTHDGDLRVWSVAKSYNADDPAKVVRILRRTDEHHTGANWMAWSKNGRIIQYSDSETLSWDVRTKHVTYDHIPTLDVVRGLAVYGPGASLFTLGANNTVQQFDLNAPAIKVRDVQHPANLLPPSPPVSIEEQAGQRSATTIMTDSDATTGTIELGISSSDEDHLSPLARIARRQDYGGVDRYESASPASSRSEFSSMSKSSVGSQTPGRYPSSVMSRPMTENTYISVGSSLRSSVAPGHRDNRDTRDTYSTGSVSGTSQSSTRSRHRPSRLRNEVLRSPDDSKVHDLFKYTRSRLSDIPYKLPSMTENSRLTNDDLRRQMLSTIFGWNKEVSDLIQDEMSRQPINAPGRILLSRWLGEIDPDIIVANSENMTSSDWMMLALNGIGGQASQHKLGRAYVQRLLENGDIHAAATIMIGMGDQNDAIEIYVSHKRYMEALLLTCLNFPHVWERQVAIIKKWGEWAVMHGQQQLAVRCFACTGTESSEPWTSPSAAQVNFQHMNPSIPEILSPPLSPPGVTRGPQRAIAKSSALKLITSFGDQGAKSKFFSQGDGGATPIAAGVTPIAESAISPGGFDVTTAFIRPSNRSQFNTPNSARSNTSAFSRKRLPSIGELPSDMSREHLKSGELPTPPVDGDRRAHSRMSSAEQESLAAGISLQRAATASPMMMRDQHTKIQKLAREAREVPPSPDALVTVKMETSMNRRNGSRDRIPKGIQLHLEPLENSMAGEITSPEQSVSSSTRFHWPSRRRGPASTAGSITSNSSAGRSLRNMNALPNSSHLDGYIHSLDAAQHYNSKKQRSRQGSRERRETSRGRDREHSRSRRRTASREASEDRGRAATRTWPKPKRSPTSPIPMSPEDLMNLSTPKVGEGKAVDEAAEPVTVRRASRSRQKQTSRASSRGSQSRRRSPDSKPRPLVLEIRGRSKSRQGSAIRSPSSPLPMSANALYYQDSEDEEDYKRAVEAQESFRTRHSNNNSRNAAREPKSPEASRRDRSESRRSESRRRHEEATDHLREYYSTAQPKSRAPSTEHAGDLKAMKDERQRKKEEAARELEERRKSLAKRPQAPTIPHPSQISPAFPRQPIESTTPPMEPPQQTQTIEPQRSMYARVGSSLPHIGLPATPKAMRLIVENSQSIPNVPPIPTTFAQRNSPNTSPKHSPGKQPESLLTLLPSTVYQPPTRPNIPRSMSAPIPDEPSPRSLGHRPSGQTSPPLSGRSISRGNSVRHGGSGSIRGIDEMLGGSGGEPRRGSQDSNMPPPPPPPPMLKELQHLAVPPPPPPAPLPHVSHSEANNQTTAVVEVVRDDGEAPSVAAPMDTTVPLLPSPAPPAGKGHSRGRSVTDNSIAGRISKATERLRSASRSRKESRTKSPIEPAPYESIPLPNNYNREYVRSPSVPTIQSLPTGLHESEMI